MLLLFSTAEEPFLRDNLFLPIVQYKTGVFINPADSRADGRRFDSLRNETRKLNESAGQAQRRLRVCEASRRGEKVITRYLKAHSYGA